MGPLFASFLGVALSWASPPVFLRLGDTSPELRARHGTPTTRWLRIVPEHRLYNNAGMVPPRRDHIPYRSFEIARGPTFRPPTDSAGTRLYAWCTTSDACIFDSTISTSGSLRLEFPGVVSELVIRGDDSYPGVLQELLGPPFLFLPLRIPGGHQTDLRVGSDCAALAAYGRRRRGEIIPYRGPSGLLPYLVAVSPGQMRRGDVLHYGVQVQVVFEDRARQGFPDAEDLVIQSWHPYPRVVRLDSSGWRPHPFRVMRFVSDTGDRTPSDRNLVDPTTLPILPRRDGPNLNGRVLNQG